MNKIPNFKDPECMLGYVDALPEDLLKAWQLGMHLPLPKAAKIRQVLICGMGGSAIGGDFVRAYLADSGSVPITSQRDYGLPHWAQGEEVLVVCSSHSGNTEETLSSFDEALARGCNLTAVCTGGKLRERAEQAGVPCWLFEHHGQPRTAIPYSFGLLLALFERLGLTENNQAEVEQAAACMREERTKLTESSPLSQNPAKRLAGQLLERNIAVFAAGDLEVVARRWKTQINELAKAWASFEGLPEMNHNTLAGLENPASLYDRTTAIFLRAGLDNPRNALRIEASMQSFLQAGIAVDSVWGKGESRLAQMWTLLQFGDYVSYYLALDYGVDPTPVNALLALKAYLAGK